MALRRPRSCQLEAIDAIRDGFARGLKGVCIEAFTGFGKAFVISKISEMARLKGGRVLVLVNRDELCNQLHKSLREQGLFPTLERGQDKASNLSELVVGSIQTMQGDRLKKWNPDHFKMVITDECFVSDTRISTPFGERFIQDIRPGDLVLAFDHSTGLIVSKKVIGARSSLSRELLRVSTKSGAVLHCTPSHPFWNGSKYVSANRLTTDSEVYSISPYAKQPCIHNQESELQALQKAYRMLEREQEEREILSELGGVKKGMGVLLIGMSEAWKIGRKSRLDYKKQSNETGEVQGEAICYDAGTWMEADSSRRKWSTATLSSTTFGFDIRMGYGACSHDTPEEGQWISAALQIGHREFNFENRSGDRRMFSRSIVSERARQEEREPIERLGLARDSVHECASYSESTSVRDGCPVFNLEVEDCNNYFANSILVHNCQFGAARTFKATLNHFRSAHHLGVTATIERHDKAGLWDGYEEVVFRMPLTEGIEQGWLVPLRFKELPVPIIISDKENAAKKFGEAEEGEVFYRDSYLPRLFTEASKECIDRKAIMFWPGCKASEAAASAFNASGIESRHLDGYMSKTQIAEILEWFSHPGPKVCHNADYLSYGYDNPSVDTVGIMRLSRSLPMLKQRIGRGTRTYGASVDDYEEAEQRRMAISMSPKPHCEILDLMLQLGEAQSTFAHVGQLITDDKSEAEYLRANRKAGVNIDLDEMRDLIRVKKSDDQKALDKLANDAANAAARNTSKREPYYLHILGRPDGNSAPASQGAIRYLKQLGYKGTTRLTKQKCYLITELFKNHKKELELA